MAPTEVHSFRCSAKTWRKATRKAQRERVSLSQVIAELLARWTNEQETPVLPSQ